MFNINQKLVFDGEPRLSREQVLEGLGNLGLLIDNPDITKDELLNNELRVTTAPRYYELSPSFAIRGSLLQAEPTALAKALLLSTELGFSLSQHDYSLVGYSDIIQVVDKVQPGKNPVPTVPLTVSPSDWPVEKALPGAYLVVGERGSGKTYYVRNTSGADVVIRFGEPFEDIDLADNVIGVSTLPEALSLAILFGLHGYTTAVDSLRSIVYGFGGAAMEGGVSAEVFTLITAVSNMFTTYGCSVMLVVNPMSGDDEKLVRLYERLASSASGAVLLIDRAIQMSDYRLADGRSITSGGRSFESSLPEADDPNMYEGTFHTGMSKYVPEQGSDPRVEQRMNGLTSAPSDDDDAELADGIPTTINFNF